MLIAYLIKHHVDCVKRLQYHVHQVGGNRTLALTQNIKHVFRDMAAGYQGIELQEPSTTFDGMETAKNGIEQFLVFGTVLQLNQLLRQKFENFTCLDQKVLENLFIRIETHAPTPLGRVNSKRAYVGR